MKSSPKPTDPADMIRVEINDYAQQKRNAQGDIANAQQALNNANQRYLLADGAEQACYALLKKLEAPSETPSPALTS
jgi:hypothetical protein